VVFFNEKTKQVSEEIFNTNQVKNKKILFSILAGLMILSSAISYSQSGKVPPFQMIQKDGKVFKAQNLPFDKPIIIIYFSPDCEECQKLTSDMLKKMEDFKKASIAMVTYLPAETLHDFIARFSLDKYPNIYVGTEGSTFFLRGYYQIEGFPFIALYNKNGDLVKIYKKEHNINDLLKQLKEL
jgi:hypothetical protein